MTLADEWAGANIADSAHAEYCSIFQFVYVFACCSCICYKEVGAMEVLLSKWFHSVEYGAMNLFLLLDPSPIIGYAWDSLTN